MDSKGNNSHGQPVNRAFNARRLAARSVDELIGICKGIVADGIVNSAEADFLVNWLDSNRPIMDVWPVNVLSLRVEKMLENNCIDELERKELFKLLTDIVGGTGKCEVVNRTTGEVAENISSPSSTLPLDKPVPEIVFEDKLFCFTGKFFYGTRKRCEGDVLERGGQSKSRITMATDYLVIGLIGSSDWLHSTHGTKIENAVKLKGNGSLISIVSEEHWSTYL